MGKLFEKKEIKPSSGPKKVVSALSKQLDSCGTANNPFMEYAKFDGKIQVSILETS